MGAKKASSLTAYLAMQSDVQYDPVYDCTVPAIQEHAAWIWEARGSLGRLQRAWMQMRPKMDANSTWAIARGPMASVWLTLLRIGWDMHSAHILKSDQGEYYSMLELAPWDIRQLLVLGVQRWQMRRIAAHLPEHDGEEFWGRAMRQCIRTKGGIWDGREIGALTCLWAGGSWPRQRIFQKGLAERATCLACGVEDDTHGHRWSRCYKVDECLEQDHVSDEDVQDSRKLRLQKGRRSMKAINSDEKQTVTSVYAIPTAPKYEPPPLRAPVYQ